MTRHFAVSAVGGDRPGIVSGVTAALAEIGCNLEDTSMTVLRGRFAMVLLVAGPDGLEADALAAALDEPAQGLGLAVWVHDVDESVPERLEGESWTVSIHGADRPGIVSHVSAALAEVGVNIVDLSTRLVGGDRPVYAMLLEVVVPDSVPGSVLTERLEAASAEMGVTVSAHPSGADIL
ncbi:MAG: glycine cleavage system transcriptional repressor [Acidimicrobiales bacterium]